MLSPRQDPRWLGGLPAAGVLTQEERKMSFARQPTPFAPDNRPESAPRPRYTEQQIRQRAYEIFLSRQREDVPGDPVSDWVRAEQELRNRSR